MVSLQFLICKLMKDVFVRSLEFLLKYSFYLQMSEDPSYALLLVYADGQLSLFNLPDFVLLHSGNVVRVYEENKRKGSNVLAATVYKNKKDEWMLISSCQKFSSVRVHLKYHN